ncbi:hypothetical protein OG840_24185 [Streptomyces sp. NBC_01764]|nr:hypothetical protein [Streptomyces sp. NBC_01764]MCX4404651.1 hypothetical protein [Streptomyces sp. NBC_01764]
MDTVRALQQSIAQHIPLDVGASGPAVGIGQLLLKNLHRVML